MAINAAASSILIGAAARTSDVVETLFLPFKSVRPAGRQGREHFLKQGEASPSLCWETLIVTFSSGRASGAMV